jgi:cytosine/adenosine deaminase-related metal-dependent hydrolase
MTSSAVAVKRTCRILFDRFVQLLIGIAPHYEFGVSALCTTSGAVAERESLLGPDVQLINTSNWNDADRARIVRSGAHVSITPHSEMRYSYALPQFVELLKLGFKVSLAMDTPPVAGTMDMFSAMRANWS